jgi:hypothetical protein
MRLFLLALFLFFVELQAEMYKDPKGWLSVVVPRLGPGRQISEMANDHFFAVTFTDDFGTFNRIEVCEFEPEEVEIIGKDLCVSFDHFIVQPRLKEGAVEVLYKEKISNFYFGVIKIGESLRGYLTYTEKNKVIFICSRYSPLLLQLSENSPGEIIEKLKKDVLGIESLLILY